MADFDNSDKPRETDTGRAEFDKIEPGIVVPERITNVAKPRISLYPFGPSNNLDLQKVLDDQYPEYKKPSFTEIDDDDLEHRIARARRW